MAQQLLHLAGVIGLGASRFRPLRVRMLCTHMPDGLVNVEHVSYARRCMARTTTFKHMLADYSRNSILHLCSSSAKFSF